MIDRKQLLADLQKRVAALEKDLLARCGEVAEIDAALRKEYDAARAKKRTAMTYNAWRGEELTQAAVAWTLAGVFVRFLEDNGLVESPFIAGPDAGRMQRARDEQALFFRGQPTATERDYLEKVFETVGALPGMREFFDRRHNPLWRVGPSGDAARELLDFWRRTDPDSGAIRHDFTDPEWDTRFLGDLYQDLSADARKKYALLQTPDFVEEFILDRTLTPAIKTFGLKEVRMIDPTCGSGHFLLGAFARLHRLWLEDDPGGNPRALAQKALDGVHGVDLNPFAVAIARFRLLLAALRVSDVKRLKDAPDFRIHLAVGDSLLHGARFRGGQARRDMRQQTFGGDEELFKDELAHFFDTEDSEALHRILGRQYHAVVGNPPYITVKDKALNQLYRDRYDSCHRQYSLSVPFMERFFDLALTGSGNGREPAGFTGQITSNSFMKREFGKKLIEEYIPKWDLTHVIDTSGAYIPGHGTPTVILFGRNVKPGDNVVRTVMGIKGEPGTPENPATGKVWASIVKQIDQPGSESEFVSAADTGREKFCKHPWSLQGGGASDARDLLESDCCSLERSIDSPVGRAVRIAEEEAFLRNPNESLTLEVRSEFREYLEGDNVRDWRCDPSPLVWYPYPTEDRRNSIFLNRLWPHRSTLAARTTFQGNMADAGREWFEYQQHTASAYVGRNSITFAEVATHNHFVIDRGGKVFKQSAPVIKLPADASEANHLRILGLLNSAVACFWMKQVFHCKGSTVDQRGARQTTVPFEDFYQIDGTKLKQFPVPAESPLNLARELDRLARELSAQSPDALAGRDAVSASALAEVELTAADLRSRMISLQEELDWQCYRHYGLIEAADDLEWPEDRLDDLPPLTLGERAFEIRMARQMAEGGLETTWFERHKDAGSKPITELPAHWPDDYRALVERRLAFIEANKNINLIERPEYKRRWNTEPWAKRQKEALRKWLLARLEGYFFEGERVCNLKEIRNPKSEIRSPFDPGAHGFSAAGEPQLVSTHQLASVVEADARWLEAAEVYTGAPGFSVSKLVKELVESESVPFLPAQRYKEPGLRKREDWERVWELQREEDRVEAEVSGQYSVISDQKSEDGDRPVEESGKPRIMEKDLKDKVRAAQLKEVGEIPVPPKYGSGDFRKTHWWKLRGKLDVPKERWVSYPGAERDGDGSPVIAWAGWDHLQQARALAAYYIDASQNRGWESDRLKPLLAGLVDLLPWLKQWHNDYDPGLGMGMGDYFAGFIEEEARRQETTVEALDELRMNPT